MFEKTNQTDTYSKKADKYGEILDEIMSKPNTDGENDGGDFDEAVSGENQSPDMTDDGRYKVIYNGREVYLTLDELKINAQKGLNYDHVKNEYDILRAQPGARELLNDARESGLSSKAYLSQQKMRDKRSRMEELMSRGVDEKTADYVTELENRLESERLNAESKKPFYEFVKRYPNINPEDISAEVWQKFHEGMDLIAAYAICENEKLRNEAQMRRQNDDTLARSVGSASGSVPDYVPDSFLEGLLG